MDNKRSHAKNLRKTEKYQEASVIYKELWENTNDKFDATGYLQCLRKMRDFERAVPLAKELIKHCRDFNWCKNEVGWTLIQGVILSPGTSFEMKLNIADLLEGLDLDITAKKVFLFRLFKEAKKNRRFDIVYDKIDLLDPVKLENTPDKTSSSDWSDRAMWYYYKTEALLNTNRPDEAIQLAEQGKLQFPRQKKFFYRLKAKGYLQKNDLNEALRIYQGLCNAPNTDWWLLSEYGEILLNRGEHEKALGLFLKASAIMPKLNMKVTLIKNLGLAYKQLKEYDKSYNHFMLTKLIREKYQWRISNELNREIEEMQKHLTKTEECGDFDYYFKECKMDWKGPEKTGNLSGTVNLGPKEKNFCFIKSNKAHYFCLKMDLPAGIEDGQKVIFDLVPSYDKKKKRESQKAVNIVLCKGG